LAGLLLSGVPSEARGGSLKEAFPRRLTFSTVTLTVKSPSGSIKDEVDWRGSLKEFFSSPLVKSGQVKALEEMQGRIEGRLMARELDGDAIEEEEEEEWVPLEDDCEASYEKEFDNPFGSGGPSLLAWGIALLITINMAVYLTPIENS